jgi:ankyrin repeat protein
MAEGLAAEAAGELPELREDEAEANPRSRFLLTDVDMLCNYCEESPCFKKCRHCKLTKYCCKSCQCADWRAHRGKCRTPEERLKLNEMLFTVCLEGKEGYMRMVNALIDRGADINAPSAKPEFTKTTPLMVASGNGSVEVMRVLLAAGAKVNQTCTDGTTALMLASQNGHVEAIRVLLAAGAQVNQIDAKGVAALMVASQNGHVLAVKVLLAAGADPRLVATNGHTALGQARHYKHTAIVSLLQAKLAELAGSA